jgi:serine/threonine protein kinase/Tfp pilus assembly protein PilF
MLKPDTTISHYRILRKLGSGGMGEVYLARDLTLDREVAVKVLPPDMASDPDRMHRFIREAKAASALKHANVALIHELGEAEGLHFIVMEYAEGQTLEAVLRRGPMETIPMIEAAIQIADALEEAHSKQVMHRDLKPANIMINPRGHVKILDFGLAKMMSNPESAKTDIATLTQTGGGAILGTVPYMSPEQALGKELDHRTDIFSIGTILYQMCTANLPFSGRTPAEVLHRIASEEPEAIARLNYNVPKEWERIVRRCLEKDAGRRYQSSRELWIDLNNLRRDLQISSSPKPKSTRRKIDSLAVLPFVNLSSDPELEYLSDGITEGLINSLSQLQRLRVVSRATVFRYKGKDMDPVHVANAVNARAILCGRVMQRDNNLSIRVELIDAGKDAQIWGEQFTQKLSDIFVLQEEIANQIAGQLKIRLTPEAKKKLARRYTEDREAYDLYLKGRYFWNKRTTDDMEKGLKFFEQALTRDSGYVLAYSGVADYYIASMSNGTIAPKEAVPKAKEAIMKALAIDNSVAELHNTLGYIHALYDWDWAAAENKFHRAMELNPEYVESYHWYAHFLIATNRPEEALAASKKCLELDPLNFAYQSHLGWHYWCVGEYENGIRHLQKVLDLDPSYLVAHFMLGRCYEGKGMREEAISEYLKSLSRMREPENVSALGHAYATSGRKEEAVKVLKQLQSMADQSYVSPCYFVLVLCGLGQVEGALHWLEVAFEERDPELIYLGVDPRYDLIRTHPRFQDIQRRVGVT